MAEKIKKIAMEILIGKLTSDELANEIQTLRDDQNNWLKNYLAQLDSVEDRLQIVEAFLSNKALHKGIDP